MLFDVNIFSSLFSATDSLTLRGYLICMAVSLILGIIIAACNTFRNRYTKSLTVTLVLLPVIVQAIIAMVNGQLGAGIAVAGAFSLIRFRSAPAQARDITSIFLAMSVGLATGMGYIGIAILLTIVVCVANIILSYTKFGSVKSGERELRIVIPESLNYEDVLEPVFAKYTTSHELIKVKTTNIGSLFQLRYRITLRNGVSVKAFIDELRIYNGNLEISCSPPESGNSGDTI